MRSCKKIPLCPMEVMPSSYKMDLQLAKAKAISNSGSTSGVMDLRRGKTCTAMVEPEGDCDPVRHLCWRNLLTGLVSSGGTHTGPACS